MLEVLFNLYNLNSYNGFISTWAVYPDGAVEYDEHGGAGKAGIWGGIWGDSSNAGRCWGCWKCY